MKRLWLILFVLPLFAQNETLAIIDFESNGVSKSESKNIVSKIENELLKLSCMQLIERNKIEEVIIEQGFQQSGCTSQECAVEIGQLLGTDKLLLGSIGKVGSLYTINARIVSVETGMLMQGYEVISESGMEQLYLSKTVELAYKICGRWSPPKPTPVRPKPTPPKKPTTETDLWTVTKITEEDKALEKKIDKFGSIVTASYFAGSRRSTHWSIGYGVGSYGGSLIIEYKQRKFAGDGIKQPLGVDYDYDLVTSNEMGIEFERGGRVSFAYGLTARINRWRVDYIGLPEDYQYSRYVDVTGDDDVDNFGEMFIAQRIILYYNYPYKKILIKFGYNYELTRANYRDSTDETDNYKYYRNGYGGIKLRIDYALNFDTFK